MLIARHTPVVGSILLLFVGMGALIANETIENRHIEFEKARVESQNLVITLEQYLRGTFGKVDLMLSEVQNILAYRGRQRKPTPSEFFYLLKKMKSAVPESQILFVTDAKGRYIANTALEPQGRNGIIPSVSIADRPYFIRHLTEPDTDWVISEPLISRTTKALIVTVSKKIRSAEGKFEGIVVAAIDVSTFSTFFSELDTGPNGVVALWNSDWVSLARYPFAKEKMGRVLGSNSVVRTMVDARVKRGTFTGTSVVDGIRRVYSYKVIDGLPLIIVVGKSEAAILAGWRRILLITSGLTLLLALLVATSIRRYLKNLEVSQKERAASFHSAKMSSLGEMAAGVAHEINNPLAIISGYASQIVSTIDSEDRIDLAEIRKMATRINDTAHRVAKIIRGLKNLARRSEGDPKSLTRISSIIESTLDLAAARFKANGILIRVQPIPELWINCRDAQISQVLLNLLNNSFDAICDLKEKWIEIEVRESLDKKVQILVTDSGGGIPPEVAEKIMQPFFTTKPINKGTGLGLSISQGIVDDHGGMLTLDAEAQNTRFVIELARVEVCSLSERLTA